MPLTSGQRLGPYEILSPIGSGGMGEVYKAKDTRLDRTVAIKVIPSHIAADSDIRERFEREARAVSSLNHPNICTLHDIGSQDGVQFIVMEHIEGETLGDRLKKGALSLEEALRYGGEVTDALDKAHRQGVVHRDLKPGNIMITKSGAKLLDFGLAKVGQVGVPSAPDLSALPTEVKPLTQRGAILGTFQYMAPEQLEGKDVDARTDIFAFGAVFYEMLTGRKVFEGESQASIIAGILEREPPAISEFQPMTPPALDHVVKTCLAKDPDDRWASAGDVRRQLQWIEETGSQAGIAATAGPQLQARHRVLWSIAGLMIGALLAAVAVSSLFRPSPGLPTRLAITTDELRRPQLALSPDGRELVYVGVRDGVTRLHHRSLNQLEAVPIRGTEEAQMPFFSPDGEWVGFFAVTDNQLKKVPLAGGRVVTICDSGFRGGASWGPDGDIVFAHMGAPGLMQVPASGGTPRVVITTESDPGMHPTWPSILPDGKGVLFVVRDLQHSRIDVESRSTGERRTLIEDGTSPRFVPTGHLLFKRKSSLWAAPFDVDRLELRGQPTRVVEGGVASFAAADDGTLVYVPELAVRRDLVSVDRQGIPTLLTERRHDYQMPRLSPDGTRLAVQILDGEFDIWVHDLARNALTRLSFSGRDMFPVWSPDGARLGFASDREKGLHDRVFAKAADGSGQAVALTARPEEEQAFGTTSWANDDRMLLALYRSEDGTWDIGITRLEGESKPEVLLQSPFDERSPSLSPDGRWLAYSSDESGRREIYVQSFPDLDAKWQISTEGGSEPAWSPKGGELFYRNGDEMRVVRYETVRTSFQPSGSRLLFKAAYDEYPQTNYAVSLDGERFFMTRQAAEQGQTEIQFVLNWFEELKELVPTQ